MHGFLGKFVPSPSELREIGWASAGGAAGTLAVQYAIKPVADKLTFLDSILKDYKADVLNALMGVVVERLTTDWNTPFAHGAVGATTGRAVASIVLRLTSQPGLSQFPEDQALSYGGSDQLAPPSDQLQLSKYFTSDNDFAEVEAEPRFTGLNGNVVEADQPLGAYLA